MATTTIPGVAVMRVGTWAASTGMSTIVPDDIEAMVQAYTDQLVDRAPVKIGHKDTRFQDADGNPPANDDGSPAYGWLENIRASADGQTLLADITGIPAKLAQVAAAAFRRRSAEIAWGVKTAAGKTYRAVLTGLALLGEKAPAVKGLDDILALYTDSGAEELSGAAGHSAVMFSDDTPTVPPSTEFSTDRGGDGATTGGHPSDTGGAAVAVSEKIREALGLAADATDEQVAQALADNGVTVLTPKTEETPGGAAPEGGTGEAGAAGTETPEAPAAPALQTAASAPVVQVDQAQFAALQESNATLTTRLAAIDAERDKARRDQVLDAAVRAGKVHPLVTSHYRALLDTDEKGTTTLLESLPAVIPVTEFGHAEQTIPGQLSEDDVKAAAAAIGLGF